MHSQIVFDYAALRRRLFALAAATVVFADAPRAFAAPAAPPANPPPATVTPAPSTERASADAGDKAVELTPFEVRAEQENSYNALETNSITRFRTELYKLPVTAEVFTETFMRDVAAVSVEDMVVTFGGASVTSQDAGASASFLNQPGDRVGSSGTPSVINLRGLPASVHRDGFVSVSPTTFGTTGLTDNFSVERVDVTSGAHSLLYGNSGGGGTINIVSKQARFGRDFARVEYRLDQFGSKRGTIDGGFSRGPVAVRAAAMLGDTKYRRVNLGSEAWGVYTQVAFKLPFNSMLRLTQQYTRAFTVNSSNVGLVDNFLYQRDSSGAIVRTSAGVPVVNTTDSRRGLNLNFLTASGRTSDLNHIFEPGLTLDNVDSFRGWRASTWNRAAYSNVLLETAVTDWLSTQVAVTYDDALLRSPVNAGGLTPPIGHTGAGNNPLNQVAIPLINPGDSEAHTRVFGFRWSMLATNQFFRGKARSQTLLGGEYTRKDGAQNGVQYRYYLANPDGSIFVNPNALNNGEYGRTRLNDSPTLWVGVQRGLVAEPFHRPGTPTIQAINPATGQMATWVRAQQRRLNPALISPNNPLGADRTGNGEFNVGHTVSHAYNLANVTDWFNGKLQTLAGARWVSQLATNYGPNAFTALPKTRKVTYSAGLSYELFPWLRPFADVSSAYNPSAQPNDPLGTPIRPPQGGALVPDFGVKFQFLNGRIMGSITYVPENTLEDDRSNIDNTYRDAINPDGINGRYLGVGGGFQGTVNVDKTTSDLDASVTANIVRNWRTRLAFHMVDGQFENTVRYRQVYNDQFHTNSAGVITYGANGPAVMVNPSTGAIAQSGGVPLTLAMMNDRTNVLWANPHPDSGRIQNTVLRSALTSVGPNGATPATGATGLPISSIQYQWDDPNRHGGFITPIVAGDATIGYARYTLSFTNRYDFDEGVLRGLGFLTNVNAAYKYRSHYYPTFGPGQTPGQTPFNLLKREMFYRPTIVTVDLGLAYQRRFGKYHWSTQVNVNNAFNKYHIIFPQSPTAATAPFFNSYVRTAEPRTWIWTNSVSF